MNRFILIVIILVVAAGGWYLLRDGGEQGGSISPLRVGDNAIYMPDQKPGISFTIGLAALANGGYVVVHETNPDGTFSAIIGASDYLTSGEHQKISMGLSRAVLDGEPLIAMLHTDNGDEVFSAADDLPLRDGQNNIMMMNFEVRADAPDAVEVMF